MTLQLLFFAGQSDRDRSRETPLAGGYDLVNPFDLYTWW
jgi:hypothetical protein